MIELIAEIAQGYEGDPKQAMLLAKGAVNGGADAVKFQLVYADELATPDYQHYALFKALEMPIEQWEKVAAIVHKGGKQLLFDVFGEESLSVALKLGASGIKLSTTEFYNDRLLSILMETGKKIYLSIGGIPVADLNEKIRAHGIKPEHPIVFMYGFQAEPTPLQSNHFARLIELKRSLPGFSFGFMDHSAGGDAEDATILPLMAISTGIEVIEKHLSLDQLLQLEDYVSAITPSRFAELVRLTRKFETVYGSSSLTLTEEEARYRLKAGKVAVATTELRAGTVLKIEHVTLKRVSAPETRTGLIKSLHDVLGKTLCTSLKPNDPIVSSSLNASNAGTANA